MSAGSITRELIGGLLFGVVPSLVIVPLLVILLLFSSWKVWNHSEMGPSIR